jgi:lipoprotein-releasing system permease protein
VRALAFILGRYLLGLSRRTHVAVVSAISLVALGLGAMALVLTLSLLEGFQATIRRELREAGPHAVLLPKSGDKLPPGPWLERLASVHPELVFRRLELGSGWVVAYGEAIPVLLEVVPGLAALEVDRVLAARGALGVGAEVALLSPAPVLSPLGPVPRRLTARVARVVPAQARAEKGTVRVPEPLGRELLPQGGREEVQVFCSPGVDPRVATARLGPLPEGVVLRSFSELHRPLLAALALERLLIGLGVSLILLVAALNLLCNLTMLAAEKRADTAILQAMGWPAGQVATLFRALGLAMGGLAGLGGTLLGWALATVLDRSRAIPLPKGVFAASHVPFHPTLPSLFLVLGVTVLAAYAAALLPARAAAQRGLLEGLRGE